ncbi:MAG: aspartyl protease family protein [Candidatus Caldarchaeales archaeon]
MGYVWLKARICNPIKREKYIEVEFLADSGAIYTAVPESLMKKIGVEEIGRGRFKLADGRVVEYPVGEAFIEIEGSGVTSIIAFLPEDATPILGLTTLELMGLQVDPVTGKLKPLELYLLYNSNMFDHS